MSDEERAKRYLELASKATKGPWKTHGINGVIFTVCYSDGERKKILFRAHNPGDNDDDLSFAAQSRTEGPYFAQRYLEAVDEVERLRDALESVFKRLELYVEEELQMLEDARQTLEGASENE